MASNWPLTVASVSRDGLDIAVAGQRGLALYSRRYSSCLSAPSMLLWLHQPRIHAVWLACCLDSSRTVQRQHRGNLLRLGLLAGLRGGACLEMSARSVSCASRWALQWPALQLSAQCIAHQCPASIAQGFLPVCTAFLPAWSLSLPVVPHTRLLVRAVHACSVAQLPCFQVQQQQNTHALCRC